MRDLLPVLDALDRAEAHWRQVLATQQPSPAAAPRGLWERLWRWLRGAPLRVAPAGLVPAEGANLAQSADEGIRLIRASLLEALRGHGLEPFDSLDQPFDPQRMRALGQRPAAADIPAGRVLEEAVRGYLWHQSLLREAQVIVATSP